MAVVQVPPAVGTSGQFIDAVIITSSTLRQIIVVGDPATSGAFAPVTSSFGLLNNISSGSYLVRSLSSGTVTLSSNPTIISASSGLIQALTSGTLIIVTVSSGFVQTLTSGPATISGTVTVVNTSSGLVQIIPQSSNAMTVFAYQSSSSANSTNVQSGATALFGYSVFNSTATIKFLKLYNTSSAPTLGSTAQFLKTILIPGSTGGAGANMISPIPMNYSTRGLSFNITANNMSATDTGVGGTALDVEVNLYII